MLATLQDRASKALAMSVAASQAARELARQLSNAVDRATSQARIAQEAARAVDSYRAGDHTGHFPPVDESIREPLTRTQDATLAVAKAQRTWASVR